MPLVLALNTNLSHYLIFSCGPIFFLLNKFHGDRKQGTGLACVSSLIACICQNSAEVANCALHEGQR